MSYQNNVSENCFFVGILETSLGLEIFSDVLSIVFSTKTWIGTIVKI